LEQVESNLFTTLLIQVLILIYVAVLLRYSEALLQVVERVQLTRPQQVVLAEMEKLVELLHLRYIHGDMVAQVQVNQAMKRVQAQVSYQIFRVLPLNTVAAEMEMLEAQQLIRDLVQEVKM
jgi:hypothetical protein